MASYTLYYFNGRGRAEISRLLFAAAGVQYADKRIELKDWEHFKSKMPCLMVPVLEIDGDKLIPQSMSIARYLAREFGFYGKNNVDMSRIDCICSCFYAIMDDYLRMYQDKDGWIMFDKLPHLRQRYKDINGNTNSDLHEESWSVGRINKRMMREMLLMYQETCRRILPFLERLLKMYNNGNLYFMGDRMTIADMMCFVALENPLYENPNLLQRYPKLEALRTRIATHQKVLPYLKKRQQTEF